MLHVFHAKVGEGVDTWYNSTVCIEKKIVRPFEFDNEIADGLKNYHILVLAFPFSGRA